VTVAADRPLAVTRAPDGADTGRREDIPPGTEAVLGPGDSALIPLGAQATKRNDGAAPAVVVRAAFEGPGGVADPGSGITYAAVTQVHTSYPGQLPPAPVTLTLSRVGFAPDGRFAPLPGATWWILTEVFRGTDRLVRQADGTIANVSGEPVDAYLVVVAPASGTPP
jgi:hypothetical protein